MTAPSLNIKSVRTSAIDFIQKIRPYSLAIFLILVGSLYGFVLFRIHALNAAQPTANSVSSQIQAAKVPRIDPSVVKQLESLQDNSVSVKALFDEARSNPFNQ
ncbi:MAG: hypothetical protein QFB86_00985 [Patescibacteria group bacterium]|nr:hypothetical protein [Patescibacteria group bacterium]